MIGFNVGANWRKIAPRQCSFLDDRIECKKEVRSSQRIRSIPYLFDSRTTCARWWWNSINWSSCWKSNCILVELDKWCEYEQMCRSATNKSLTSTKSITMVESSDSADVLMSLCKLAHCSIKIGSPKSKSSSRTFLSMRLSIHSRPHVAAASPCIAARQYFALMELSLKNEEQYVVLEV